MTIHLKEQKLSLRKNDLVQVIAGREKGKTGRILKIDSVASRVTVENLNTVVRHKPAGAGGEGSIVNKQQPLHYSNVQLFCSKCNRGVRHGHQILEKSETQPRRKKIRICKRCGEKLDQA